MPYVVAHEFLCCLWTMDSLFRGILRVENIARTCEIRTPGALRNERFLVLSACWLVRSLSTPSLIVNLVLFFEHFVCCFHTGWTAIIFMCRPSVSNMCLDGRITCSFRHSPRLVAPRVVPPDTTAVTKWKSHSNQCCIPRTIPRFIIERLPARSINCRGPAPPQVCRAK